MTAFLESVDTIFFGRKSHELQMRLAPDMFPDKQKIIFSTTLSPHETDFRIVRGNIDREVRALQKEAGKNIWLFGGAELTTSFLSHNLIDEMLISVHPILLGGGKKLVSGLDRIIQLKPISSIPYSSGLVQHRYRLK